MAHIKHSEDVTVDIRRCSHCGYCAVAEDAAGECPRCGNTFRPQFGRPTKWPIGTTVRSDGTLIVPV